MIDERIEDLMWQKIEGKISDEDQSQLEAHLEQHPGDKSYFDELVTMSNLLDSTEEVEPPANLRQRIEAEIDWDTYPAVEQSHGFDWRRFFSSWWDLRVAAAAAAGIFIGLSVYPTIISRVNPQLDFPDEVVGGTIGNASNLVIESDGVDGILIFRRGDKSATSDLKINSDREIEVVLEYAGQTTTLRATGEEGSAPGGITTEGNTVRVTHYGKGRYLVAFQPATSSDAPLTVRVSADGLVLLEEEVRPK